MLQGYNEDSGVGLVGLTVNKTVKRYTFQGDLGKKKNNNNFVSVLTHFGHIDSMVFWFKMLEGGLQNEYFWSHI